MYNFISIQHLVVLLCYLSSSVTWAQTVQSLLWNVPDGKQPDLAQTFKSGNTLPLSWNNFSTNQHVDTTKNLVDLWVTSYDTNVNSFNQSLKQGINLTFPGTYSWTIAIPDSDLAESAKYVLRFKQSSSTFDPNSGELSSPGFIVLNAVTATSSSSASTTASSSSTSTSLSSTAAAQSTPPPSQTSAPAQTSSSSGLSGGAKAGIGIGVVIAVVGLAGVVFMLMRRRRKGEAPTDPAQTPMYADNPSELPTAGQTQVDMNYGHASKIQHAYPTELPGS